VTVVCENYPESQISEEIFLDIQRAIGRLRWCLFLSPVGVPTVGPGILDPSVSHHSY